MFPFSKLFEPGQIGTMDLKNRIIFPPMATHMATLEGDVTDQLVNYYIERARGVGLVVIEGSFPSPVGHPKRIALDHDGRLAGLQRLVRALHQEGAKVMIEVNTHMGRQDQNPLSPSDLPHPITGKRGKPVDAADIERMLKEYGDAAKRVKKAGFDGIMIHGGTGYLVAEFLSPLVNKRTDEYGGDVRRRARFALDVIDVTRKSVGAGYPVVFRLMAHDRVPGGFDTDDAIVTCKLFQDHGVDAVDIITGSAVSHEWTAPYMYLPAGCNTDVSGAVRKEVSMPIAVAGKINDPVLAEQILRAGMTDFVDIGRGLLADPNFVVKTIEGKAGRSGSALPVYGARNSTSFPGTPWCVRSILPWEKRKSTRRRSRGPSRGKKCLSWGAARPEWRLPSSLTGEDMTSCCGRGAIAWEEI